MLLISARLRYLPIAALISSAALVATERSPLGRCPRPCLQKVSLLGRCDYAGYFDGLGHKCQVGYDFTISLCEVEFAAWERE